MTALNVDLPADVIERLQLAKVLTSKSIRQIALEAIETWLRQNGVTPEKVLKLKGNKP